MIFIIHVMLCNILFMIGAERMSSMSPDDIRKQAATMKAMGPAALRAMNPQMASLSGEFLLWLVVHTNSITSWSYH